MCGDRRKESCLFVFSLLCLSRHVGSWDDNACHHNISNISRECREMDTSYDCNNLNLFLMQLCLQPAYVWLTAQSPHKHCKLLRYLMSSQGGWQPFIKSSIAFSKPFFNHSFWKIPHGDLVYTSRMVPAPAFLWSMLYYLRDTVIYKTTKRPQLTLQPRYARYCTHIRRAYSLN